MLSPLSRSLTYALAFVYSVLGLALFLAPEFSASRFPWKVEPLAAMTMGGWCIGSAAFAWESARRWRWSVVHACLLFLWIFGLGESLVLLAFFKAIRWDALLTPFYVLALGVNLVAALIGLSDWLRLRPATVSGGDPVGWTARVIGVVFVAFVGYLAYRGFIARAGSGSTEGAIFPAKLTLFSVRAFAVFYLALALSALPLLWSRGTAAGLVYVRAGLAFVIPITAAALAYWELFDFTHRPGGMLYLGAYAAAFLAAVGLLFTQGRDAGPG